MNEVYVYINPPAHPQLKLDDGAVIIGYGPVGAHGRPDAYHFQLSPGTAKQGGLLTMTPAVAGFKTKTQRGMVEPNEHGEAVFRADDFTLDPVEASPSAPHGELDEGKQEPIGTKPPPVG